jgi:hypothetical protein
MRRSRKVVASAVSVMTASAVMASGVLPAYADPPPFKAEPSTVHPGGTVTLHYACGTPAVGAEIWGREDNPASLFTGRRTVRPAIGSTKVTVPTSAAPGEYMLNLQCIDAAGTDLGYNAGSFTVVKGPPPPPPPPPYHKPRKPHPHMTVRTGFGGMARSVALHHPFP